MWEHSTFLLHDRSNVTNGQRAYCILIRVCGLGLMIHLLRCAGCQAPKVQMPHLRACSLVAHARSATLIGRPQHLRKHRKPIRQALSNITLVDDQVVAPQAPVCSCEFCRRYYLAVALAIASVAVTGGLTYEAARQGDVGRRLLVREMQAMADYERLVAERKRQLFQAALAGHQRAQVVEIGVGTGVNFPYLFEAGVRKVVAVEPNPHFMPVAEDSARRAGLQLQLRHGFMEKLPFESNSVDVVVATLVLCSVSDVATAVAEVRRVLRPGGIYIFTEHVAAPRGTWLHVLQSVLNPVNQVLAVGCKLTNEPLPIIQRTFGSAQLKVQHWDLRSDADGPFISHLALSPHISGFAEC